jgi:LmbE family N-acetylglucosaminyl deacetylase
MSTQPGCARPSRRGIARVHASFALVALVLSALSAFAGRAHADLLVIAPHPDDDIITSAGLIARARAAGETVWVLYMTNGDVLGYTSGLMREDEAVAAQALLGVPEDHLIFLGYPDGFVQDLHGPFFPSNTARMGSSGLNTTFGDRGLGHMDYHRYVFGASAANNGTNLRNDLAHVLTSYRPGHIFVTSEFDQHPDHATTYAFLIDALAVAIAGSPSYSPTVHKTIVWNNTANQTAWPAAPNPTVNFTEPPSLLSRTGLVWAQRESLDVPLAAQVMPALVNMKAKATNAHQTQGGYTGSQNGYISAFLHKDEFFWPAQSQGGNRPPVPSAGSDVLASAGQNVQLNGSASFDPDGTALNYQWRQVAGPTVTLSSATAAQPSFVVPAGTNTPTAFSFELKVNDGMFSSVADAMSVLVNTSSVPLPTGSNVALIATASASTQSGGQEASKAIDGSPAGFTPADPSNSAHEWASNDQGVGAWIQLTWPSAQTLDRVRLFDRPNTDDNVLAGTLTFSSGASINVGTLPNSGGLEVAFSTRSVTWVRFTVSQVGAQTYSVGLSEFEAYGPSGGTTPPVNQAPSASVGANQSVLGGALVSLSGSGSDPEGTSLTYSWTQVSGASVTLSSANVANPTFVAPAATTSAQLLDFMLVVSDGSLSSTNNPVTRVTVQATSTPGNQAPVADAGADQSALANRLVTLNGSASSDAEGSALSYTWSQVSGPSVLLSRTDVASPTFIAPAATTSVQTLVFRLLVNDGTQNSLLADDVTVTLPVSNVALVASATASTGQANNGANKAIDGYKDSASGHEWITSGQRTGAWIQLNWPSARNINQVRLYDRPSSTQRVTGGTLSFSSGANVSVGSLPNDGAALTVSFSARNVSWVRLTVSSVSSTTTNVGLSEFEVFDTNVRPTADAGADRSVTGGTSVSLTGSGSDPEGTTLSYAWAQVADTSVTLSGSGATRTFTAPAAALLAQTLRFQLTVSDSAGAQAVDEVVITVPAASTPPANQAPTANAGASQTVSGGASVTLSGSGSDPEGTPLSYAWSQLSGPSVTLSDSGATRSFAAPAATSTAQTLIFQLIVSDGSLASAPAQTTVTVAASTPPVNQAPSANAGASQAVSGGASVTLSGSGTDPEGATLTYTWSQVSGTSVTLGGAGALRSFIAPAATTSVQTLVFQLVTSDGSLSSTPSETTVTVAASAPPAGGTNLALTATASASSAGASQPADRVRDGFTDGYPTDASHEWASNAQGVNAWVQLTWSSAQTLNQVRLFDRPNTDDRVMAGTLTFSNGASVAVGPLDNAGAGLAVSFSSRSVTWVRFTVTQVSASTYNVGLAEFQAFNSDAPVANGVPTANAGASQSVAQGATVTLSGSASSDPEGAALTYDWAQTSGPAVLTVDNVANPTFVAPSGSSTDLTLTFELVVSDGPNTSTPATTTVTVLAPGGTPPPSSTNFALTATATASSQEASQGAAKARDGFTDGYPSDATHEWSTQGQGVNAWLQFTWSIAQTISQVVLYDRPNADDNVLAGTLTFSNGASVAVGALPNTSGSRAVSFSARSVTWVRFTVNQISANTYNVGLAEMEVH